MRKLMVLTLIAMLAIPFAAFAQTAAPTTAAPSITVPISGATNGGGRVDGTFQIQKFAVVDNKLMAVGNLVANITQQGATRTVVAAGTMIPVATPNSAVGAAPNAAAAACQILNLTLGPLDLNLLGLQVHLNQVVLNITAQSGAGNLLGNLLCSVANLLNGGGPLTQIADLLNQLLGALGNLGL